MISSVGFVGAGKFGSFAIDRIREQSKGLDIRAWDKATGSSEGLGDVLRSDAIVFAVPPKDYGPALRELVPETPLGTIIVDICTVKMHTVGILKQVTHGRQYLAMHPMFGPQSYRDNDNSLKGLNMIVCDKQMREGDYSAMEHLFTARLGLNVVKMTPHEHDRMQAIYQLLPQRIGCVVNRAGFKLEQGGVPTLSAQHFFKAMQIVQDDEELFRQCCRLNPYWPLVWQRFLAAEAQLDLEMLEEELREMDVALAA